MNTPKPRGTRLGAPNKSNPLTVNGVSFTQLELDTIKQYVEGSYPRDKAGTLNHVIKKIRKAKPLWSPTLATRQVLFKFAYGEGLAKL